MLHCRHACQHPHVRMSVVVLLTAACTWQYRRSGALSRVSVLEDFKSLCMFESMDIDYMTLYIDILTVRLSVTDSRQEFHLCDCLLRSGLHSFSS